MKRFWRLLGVVVVRALCLPSDIAGWLVVLCAHALWGNRGSLGLRDGILVSEMAVGAWPARTWFKQWAGVTIGHAVLFGGGRARERVWNHEKVHVDQCEAAHCASALAAIGALALGAPWTALLVWSLGYGGMVLGGIAAAWMRGGDPYYDSAHERAAYALDGQGDAEVTRRSRRPLRS